MSLKNPVKPPAIDPGTVRLVAQRLNHYATPGLCIGRSVQIKLHCLKPNEVLSYESKGNAVNTLLKWSIHMLVTFSDKGG